MQNKGAIVLFTLLLGIASLFVLSKNVVSRQFEKKAEEFVKVNYEDSLLALFPNSPDSVTRGLDIEKRKYLRDSSNVEVYPVMDYTYREVKSSELNFGLDLQGGMSVTLEIQVPALLQALTGNTPNEVFNSAIESAKAAQQNSQDDYITLFEQAWAEKSAGTPNEGQLWKFFNTIDNQDKFPTNVSDDDIIALLREEAEAAINNSEEIIRKRVDRFGVAQPVVQQQTGSGRIVVELPGVDDRERVGRVLKATANLEFWDVYTLNEVYAQIAEASTAVGKSRYPEAFIEEESDDDDADAATDAGNDNDEADASADGSEEPADSSATDLEDLVSDEDSDLEDLISDDEEPEVEELSDEERDRIRKQNPILAYANMDPRLYNPNGSIVGAAIKSDIEKVNDFINDPAAQAILPSDLRLMWAADPRPQVADDEGNVGPELFNLYAIKVTEDGKPRIDGSQIVDASQDFDEFSQPTVTMRMNAEATSEWASWTQQAAAQNNRQIAIVMDDLVYSAPSVDEPIPNGTSQIRMGGDNRSEQLEEATDLAGLLKAGSLPAEARIVDQYTVGPTLGEKNIRSGLMSFILALAVILVYMIFYYKGAGLVSNVALLVNLLFLVAALASFGAALTLPGIAGIVLTIGMAVDANVLIYERVREEIRLGKGMSVALKDGYRKAYSAIVDANITTLLTAIILFTFGSGPIKGFATTLIIGIFTSLFSAIIITRLIFFNRLEKKKPISFWTNLTKDWFTKMNYQFVSNRRKFYVLSGLIIAAGIASLAIRNLDYGVDFTGGNQFRVAFDQSIDVEELRGSLEDSFTVDGKPGSAIVQNVGGSNSYQIKTDYLIDSTADDREEQITAGLEDGLDKLGVGYRIESNTQVDPTISDDFRQDAIMAALFSLLIIFIYILIRFRKWQFGAGAILAMVHDVMIVLSLFSLLWGIAPFSLEINQAFIAAILTVIGYSINDTVVVFDRIREYLGEYKKDDDRTVINKALNSTLSRTINTSLSTFVVLLTIFIFGENEIRGFAFALMVGVIVGTYSSIFIATPSVVDLSKNIRS